jgi:hypothetical protein
MMPVKHMRISILEEMFIMTSRQALAVAILPFQVTQADLATAAARTRRLVKHWTVQRRSIALRRYEVEGIGMLFEQ